MLLSRNSRLAALFCAGLLLCPCALAADPSSAAVSEAGATPAQTAAIMAAIRARGAGTVFVDVFENGSPKFPSAVMKAVTAATQEPTSNRRDGLRDALIEAHRNGLNFIAWFQSGLMAAQKGGASMLTTQKPEWLSRNASGSEIAPDGTVWLSLMQPEARRFLLDLAVEIVEKYDVDGVRLDETSVWPHPSMGHDESTRAAYARDHGGAAVPADPDDAEWLRWRASKINEFGAQLRNAVNARRPSMRVVSSPDAVTSYPPKWRTPALVLLRAPGPRNLRAGQNRWRIDGLTRGRYRLIGNDGTGWDYLDDVRQDHSASIMTSTYFFQPFTYSRVELVQDRRPDMRQAPAGAR